MNKLFPANEGVVDRVLRVALGLGLLALAFVGPKTPFGFLGVIPLATGLLGTCPLYTLLGLSTCPTKPRAMT
ncbi:MAG: DUF2892 domain-containing protein [Polyangiales bacterium]